jgi:hypothetical protein
MTRLTTLCSAGAPRTRCLKSVVRIALRRLKHDVSRWAYFDTDVPEPELSN